MGEKGESGSKRGEQKWATGVVQKGPVRVYMVPNKQGATERVALQDQESGHRQVPMWGGDDKDTRGGRVSGTGAVEAAEGGLAEVEGGPRGTGGK